YVTTPLFKYIYGNYSFLKRYPLNYFLRISLFMFCVKQSIIISQITILIPATQLVPTCERCNADNTSRPNPGAPIIEAITTIDNDSITVWLIPAMMVALAIGSSTLNNFCAPVVPNASAASTSSVETCLIPKLVIRTVGGVAKINEANIPGTIPIPKNATAGIK